MAGSGSGDDTGAAAAAKDAVVDITAVQLCREDRRARLEEIGGIRGENDAKFGPSKFVGTTSPTLAVGMRGHTSSDGYFINPLHEELESSSSTAPSSKIGGFSPATTPRAFGAGGDDLAGALRAGGQSSNTIKDIFDELINDGFDDNFNNHHDVYDLVNDVDRASTHHEVLAESKGLDGAALLGSTGPAPCPGAPPLAAEALRRQCPPPRDDVRGGLQPGGLCSTWGTTSSEDLDTDAFGGGSGVGCRTLGARASTTTQPTMEKSGLAARRRVWVDGQCFTGVAATMEVH